MAKAPPPPKSINKGDVVRWKHLIGVVCGDHTSPGGIQGHRLVAVFQGVISIGKSVEELDGTIRFHCAMHRVFIPVDQLEPFDGLPEPLPPVEAWEVLEGRHDSLSPYVLG